MSSTDTLSSNFHRMELNLASEDISLAKNWLSKYNNVFGDYILNEHVVGCNRDKSESLTYEIGDLCLQVKIVQNDNKDYSDIPTVAFEKWRDFSCHTRARHLYNIAQHLQQNSDLLAAVGVLSGTEIGKMKNVVLPQLVEHFYYYAGCAQLMDTEHPNMKPLGSILFTDYSIHAVSELTLQFGYALAMGNTILVSFSGWQHIFAILFAEICAEAGLPLGVICVLSSPPEMWNKRNLYLACADSQQKLKMVVYDSADIDSAVEGILQLILNSEDRATYSGSTLFVQQSIYKEFFAKLRRRMDNLIVKSCKNEFSREAKEEEDLLQIAEGYNAEIYRFKNKSGLYEDFPLLITGLETTSGIDMDNIPYKIMIAFSFRTAKEAANLCNHSLGCYDAVIYTEKLPLAIETAKVLKANTVCINCTKVLNSAETMDPWTYLQTDEYNTVSKVLGKKCMQPSWVESTIEDDNDMKKTSKSKNPSKVDQIKIETHPKVIPGVDSTFKLYYGGEQKGPGNGSHRVITNSDGVKIAYVPEANSTNVRLAASAAQKAQLPWQKRSGYNRSQILFTLGEKLLHGNKEMASLLVKYCHTSNECAENEVDYAIDRLFHWAALANKYGGGVEETVMPGLFVKLHEAVGVTVIGCPEEAPLLAFVSLLAPAIARGNTVVIFPSEKCAIPALEFYKILEESDVPAGVVNILSGKHSNLYNQLHHNEIQCFWGFSNLLHFREFSDSRKLNQTVVWKDYPQTRDWFDSTQGQGYEFLDWCTRTKNVWMPMGETFAN